MKRFDLERVPGFDPKAWLRKTPGEGDAPKLYTEPGIYFLDGVPVIVYGKLTDRYDRMLWAIASLGYTRESRSTGGGAIDERNREKLGESRIFGFRGRIPFGANYCSVSSTAETHPAQHSIICDFGRLLNALYETTAPDCAARHSAALKHISADWVLPGTRFTSGIVNRDNPLRYHYDRGNLRDVMSCMAVFRNLVDGGNLAVPEFGARWALDDHSYFLFDGQRFLHGVTPIRKLNKRAYRYSVVYYALRAMEKCGTLEEEISRARAEKRAREKRRV